MCMCACICVGDVSEDFFPLRSLAVHVDSTRLFIYRPWSDVICSAPGNLIRVYLIWGFSLWIAKIWILVLSDKSCSSLLC